MVEITNLKEPLALPRRTVKFPHDYSMGTLYVHEPDPEMPRRPSCGIYPVNRRTHASTTIDRRIRPHFLNRIMPPYELDVNIFMMV